MNKDAAAKAPLTDFAGQRLSPPSTNRERLSLENSTFSIWHPCDKLWQIEE